MSTVLKPFTVTPRALHELIVLPQFGDFVADGATTPSPEEGDWQIMNDVAYQRPILELTGSQNILKRRDATCKLIYSPVGRMSARYVRTEKLYGATQDCQEEFYQGCFEDYSQGNFDEFGQYVMPLMEAGMAADIYTNKYFGDLTRPADPNNIWSWNKFDGVFTHMARYIGENVIKAAQTFTIAGGTLTPQQAHDHLANAYANQTSLMKMMDKQNKIFYVSSDLADAYHDWLVLAGNASVSDRMSATPKLMFKGIPVKVKNWDGILTALNNGTAAHAVVLTLKGNFLFATDSTYGGGPRRNEAVRVWWSDDDNVWRRQFHLKAGTEIISPQNLVLGITSF